MKINKFSKTLFISLIILAAFLMFFSRNSQIYAAPLLSTSNVVINEIYQGEDWIELYNGTSGAVDISGWKIDVVSACNTTPYIVPENISIPSGGYIVINGSGDPANNTSTNLYHTDCFSYAAEYSIAISLESTSTGIDFLRTGSSTASPPLGTIWTGENPPAGYTSLSLGRDAVGTDTDDGSDWVSQNPTKQAVNDPNTQQCIATVYGDGHVSLDPTNSDGCGYGTYVDGEVISLTADAPVAGYKIGGWIQTDDDYNNTRYNTITVDGPSNWHMVGVNYVQDPPPQGSVLLIENTWSEGFSNLSQYTSALTALNIPYDFWWTRFSDSVPTASIMSAYDAVILIRHWGDTTSFPESYFSSYLDDGGCMMMSNQDYTLTSFLESYFGVSSISQSTENTFVSGTGSIFGSLGPFALDFNQGILQNSDNGNMISINASALPAFTANNGLIAATKETADYKTIFMGFQFEALPTQQSREDVLKAFYSWCVPSTVLQPGTYDDSNEVLQYTGDWSQTSVVGATNNNWHQSTTIGDSMQVRFSGKQIRVIYGKDSDLGTLAVYIDDVLVDTIDENASSAQHQQIWESNALSSGEHTLRLVHSSGTKVVLDGLTIFAEALPAAPTLISPSGTKDTNDPLFVWYAAERASGYWLTVGRSSDGAYLFNSYVQPNTNGYTCWFSLPGALSDGDYWFKVTAGNVSGWGAVSEPMNFKIATSQPPEAPTLIAPSGAQNVGNPLFVWYATESASGYWMTVGRSSDGTYLFNSYVQPNTNGYTCWFNLPVMLSDGDYWFRVTAGNASGWGAASEQMNFSVSVSQPPAAPTLISPNGTETTNNPLFVWYAAENASGYWMTVGRSSDGAYVYNSYVQPSTNGYTCWYSLPVSLSNGDYWFRVTAGNASGWGSASAEMNFSVSVSQPPAAPTLISPNETVDTNNPLFVWYATKNASGYWLTVGRSSDGAYLFNSYVQPNTNGYTCWLNLPVTFEDGNYWFRVTAGNASGWGSASAQMEFVIDQ